ncbi:MAG: replicative DNA helicase, partial [Clostridia bacterium]|nr:replicative DNA helicase [Clostridia bacterium]
MATPAPKLLPQSIEAEQALLGCILIDGQVPFTVFSLINPEDFYSEIHKIIFEKMLKIYSENKPIDYITLTEKLESASLLERIGGLEYLTTLTNVVPSAANFKYYLDIVKNHARKRNLIYASQKTIEKSFSGENSKDILSFAEKQIFDLAEQDDQTSLEHIEKGLKEVIKKFDMIAKDKGCLLGIPTGFKKLDEITNGLQNSDLILLAARPGVGKTSLAMNIVDYAAINHKKSCAIFSLEMPTAQLAQRSLCSVACVNMQKALTGSLDDEEWRRLWYANKQLGDAKIYIDDSGLNTPMDILSKCRRLKREKGLDLIMIDYLQLMRSGLRQDNRVLEIAEITRNLKIAAKELNVPIVLLSQLSRTVEIRK